MRTARRDKRSGQAIVFLVMALVILLFAALWSADIHRIIFVKDRSQNAGDAATLAAARWQASSLNLMGELNLLHALALALGDDNAVDVITNTQARLCFSGPMAGMAASQQAAKLNGIYAEEEFTSFVRAHAHTVRTGYTEVFGGQMLFPEPYPGAWIDYADMLDAVADDGVAAGPDNAVLYTDATGGHTLYNRAFYESVAGRSWCWFYLNAPGLLESYTGYTWWPDLPPIDLRRYSNSEFFSLEVGAHQAPLLRLISEPRLELAVEESGHDMVNDTSNHWARTDQQWYTYSRDRWTRWDAMDRPFPVTGTVRPQFDYTGADAITRVNARLDRFTPGSGGGTRQDAVVWTSAGKAFGFLELEGDPIVPNAYGFVLPAFREVRLMPIDAASMPGGGSFDMGWRQHLVDHLPIYMERGPSALDHSCWYCMQLVTWENPRFRDEGVQWLSKYSSRCTVNPTGGGRHGGGSRRAH